MLSIPNVLLEFIAEINSWRLIKSLHDRLLRDLFESRFFNCGRPLALCRAAYSPAISESFLVFLIKFDLSKDSRGEHHDLDGP